MEAIFVDANVVMELLFKRAKSVQAKAAITKLDRLYYISPLTVHLVYYCGQKDRLDPELITTLLEKFRVIPMDSKVVRLAQQRYTGKDFEDCLQAATAEQARCDEVLTFDRDFQADSGTKLPVTVVC